MNKHYEAGHFQGDANAWLRVSNDGSGWVDAKKKTAPVYGGPGVTGGHNLSGYPDWNNMLVGEFSVTQLLTKH